MKGLLSLLVYGVIAVAAALGLAALPGRVSADIGAITVDLPTSLALLALLLLLGILHLLLGFFRLPYRLGTANAARRRSQGDDATTGALVALAAADPSTARRQASRARKFLGDTPQTLLLAAEAGRLAGREEEASSALRALVALPEAAFLGFRGLLRQAIARQDWADAAELARQAEAAHPGASWLREERARLAIRGADWSEAMRLTNDLSAKASLAIAAAQTDPDPDRGLGLARKAWEDDPGLAPAALGFAGRLRSLGREGRAQTVIADSWAIRPHPDLGAFAMAAAPTPLDAVKVAKTLAAANPSDPESHLLMARASLAAGLTGEARRQAREAHDAGMNQRRLFLVVAAIEEAEDRNSDAATAALRQAALADPDPVWRCTECHAESGEWHPACPACQIPGALRWGSDTTPALPRPGIMRRLWPWR